MTINEDKAQARPQLSGPQYAAIGAVSGMIEVCIQQPMVYIKNCIQVRLHSMILHKKEPLYYVAKPCIITSSRHYVPWRRCHLCIDRTCFGHSICRRWNVVVVFPPPPPPSSSSSLRHSFDPVFFVVGNLPCENRDGSRSWYVLFLAQFSCGTRHDIAATDRA
jgi:hypothetical protein